VLTPMPCLPVIAAPWTPGAPGVKVLKKTALTADSKCQCNWSGTIEIVEPSSAIDIDE